MTQGQASTVDTLARGRRDPAPRIGVHDGPAITPSEHNASELFTRVYGRLKVMARRIRACAGQGTMCTTEIVHEVYVRMNGECDKRFALPAQFFAYAARAMRHLLVDSARRRLQPKSGGDLLRVPMTDPAVSEVAMSPAQAIELDQALSALERDDARAAKVVELHYFAGLPLVRIAELLALNVRTVDRDWRYARSFLAAHLEPELAAAS